MLRIANGSLYANTFSNVLSSNASRANSTVTEQLDYAQNLVTIDNNVSSVALPTGNNSEEHEKTSGVPTEQEGIFLKVTDIIKSFSVF